MNRTLIIKTIVQSTSNFIGWILYLICPIRLHNYICLYYRYIYTSRYKRFFKTFGKNSLLDIDSKLINPKYIAIGESVTIGKRSVLSTWDKYEHELFTPMIHINDGCIIGDDFHITAITKITIGKNVLMGKKITITDNSHGNNTLKEKDIPPIKRKLYSKGPVVIEDNVWIGDKVTILPNVYIGTGAVIGANSVVTNDVLPYTIVGGIPAKKIRIME